MSLRLAWRINKQENEKQNQRFLYFELAFDSRPCLWEKANSKDKHDCSFITNYNYWQWIGAPVKWGRSIWWVPTKCSVLWGGLHVCVGLREGIATVLWWKNPTLGAELVVLGERQHNQGQVLLKGWDLSCSHPPPCRYILRPWLQSREMSVHCADKATDWERRTIYQSHTESDRSGIQSKAYVTARARASGTEQGFV